MKGSVGRLFIGLSALTLLGFDSNLINSSVHFCYFYLDLSHIEGVMAIFRFRRKLCGILTLRLSQNTCLTIRAAQIWKIDCLVVSLLRRSHVEPLPGFFRDDDGLCRFATPVSLADQNHHMSGANSGRLFTTGQQKTVCIV